MRLSGKLIKDTRIVKTAMMEKEEGASFRDALEECLIGLCKELDIPVPLWLKKNTTEFVRYKKTVFMKDQFVEKIHFDKFEIRIE